jgi:hypothetical protein
MSRRIYLDLDGTSGIRVAVYRGAQREPKVTIFPVADRAKAEAFAESQMGRKGMVMSTLDMTPEQLAALKAREAATRARLEASMARLEAMRGAKA